MIGCLRTCVHKQPIIALYFEFENGLKFYNLQAWLLGMMKFASLEANLDGDPDLFAYPILLLSLPVSWRSPDMTEILLTGTFSLNSINESIKPFHSAGFFHTYCYKKYRIVRFVC